MSARNLHTTGIVVKEAADEIYRIGHFPPELIRPIWGVRLYGSRGASVPLDSPGYFFLATDTPNLMRWLIEQASNAGVDVRLGTLFTGARRERGGFAVDDIGRIRFIVGADGPTSKVARTFELGVNREFLFGVEAELTGVALPERNVCTVFSPPPRTRLYRVGVRWRWRHGYWFGRPTTPRRPNGGSRRF